MPERRVYSAGRAPFDSQIEGAEQEIEARGRWPLSTRDARIFCRN